LVGNSGDAAERMHVDGIIRVWIGERWRGGGVLRRWLREEDSCYGP
jgi:hypothetical protein